jgi:hypothetical protein
MAPTDTPWGVWDPLPPARVASLLSATAVPWWIAGGHAIELAVGRNVRPHVDVDVLVLRRDQLAVQRALPGWEWWAADPPGVLRRWRPGEYLPNGVHDIWCRPGAEQSWRVQVMLDESRGGDWVSRRNGRVCRPITALGRMSVDGIPYLAPDVQLFYKAKEPRAKDEADFAAVLPFLDADRRRWLRRAITDTYGKHPWTRRLDPPDRCDRH